MPLYGAQEVMMIVSKATTSGACLSSPPLTLKTMMNNGSDKLLMRQRK